MRAAKLGLVDSMKVLIEYGGDVYYKTKNGLSISKIANACEDPDKWLCTVDFLMDELRKPNIPILSRDELFIEALYSFVQQMKENNQFEAFKLESGLKDKTDIVSDGSDLFYCR